MLAACIIARNEQANLSRCLPSLAELVDEIVVLDTGSDDGSVDVAARWATSVVQGTWSDDFAQARNDAKSLTDAEWILTIDADEVAVAGASASCLRGFLRACASNVGAVSVVISNASGPDVAGLEHHREFKILRRAAADFVGRVHEHPRNLEYMCTAELPESVLTLRHHGYSDAELVMQKAARNARLSAIMLAETPAEDVLERSRVCLDLGRSLMAAGEPVAAYEALEQARTFADRDSSIWAWATDMQARLALLRELPQQCLIFADELQHQTGLRAYCDWLRCRAFVQLGHIPHAVLLLDALVGEPVIDVGGHLLSETTFVQFRATLSASV